MRRNNKIASNLKTTTLNTTFFSWKTLFRWEPLTKDLDGSLNSTHSLTTSLKVPSLFTIQDQNGEEVHFAATSTPVALHAIK